MNPILVTVTGSTNNFLKIPQKFPLGSSVVKFSLVQKREFYGYWKEFRREMNKVNRIPDDEGDIEY